MDADIVVVLQDVGSPHPADEEKRLALLKACNIMYTPAEEAFDDVARLAADLCGAEIALITLVGENRQWFKARVGVSQTDTARDLSFVGTALQVTSSSWWRIHTSTHASRTTRS